MHSGFHQQKQNKFGQTKTLLDFSVKYVIIILYFDMKGVALQYLKEWNNLRRIENFIHN